MDSVHAGCGGAFLRLGLAHEILAEKLRPAGAGGSAGALIDGWSGGLADYAPEKIAAQIGVPAATITRIAREAAVQGPAVAMIGDAATAHTNGYFNALAVKLRSMSCLGAWANREESIFALHAESKFRENFRNGKRQRQHGGPHTKDSQIVFAQPQSRRRCSCFTIRTRCSQHRLRQACGIRWPRFLLLRALEISLTKRARWRI